MSPPIPSLLCLRGFTVAGNSGLERVHRCNQLLVAEAVGAGDDECHGPEQLPDFSDSIGGKRLI